MPIFLFLKFDKYFKIYIINNVKVVSLSDNINQMELK